MRRPSRLVLLLTALSLAATACGGTDAGDADRPTGDGSSVAAGAPRLVVTTTILGDVVRRVVGTDAEVEVLMAPGQDPHGFSPSAQQAAGLRDADLVVANGLQLEESLLDALAAAEQDGAEVLRVADQLDPIPFEGGHDEDHEGEDEDHDHEDADHAEEGHDHGPDDPHVWLDPVRMADGARVIAAAVAGVDDTLDDETWTERGEAVAEEILAVHEQVVETLAVVPEACRALVTNHEALGYFAARYDFEVVGTVVPGTSTQGEPSAQEFAALAATLRETQVPAIFTETTQSTRLADTLAGEVGRDIEVVQLHTGSLGPPASGADTYTGLLLTDARLVADALGDC